MAFACDISIVALDTDTAMQIVQNITRCVYKVNPRVHLGNSEIIWSKHPNGTQDSKVSGNTIPIKDQIIILGHALAFRANSEHCFEHRL